MTARQLSLWKSGRQRGVLPPDPLEFEQQCAVASRLRWCGNPNWLWTAFPAGEWRTPATAGRVKAMGLNPGFFDLLFIDPDGQHRWLEMKRGAHARLTEEQAAFSLAMLARGVPAEVARSQDEAVDILQEWGALKGSLHEP